MFRGRLRAVALGCTIAMGLVAVSPPVVAEDSRRALPSEPPVAPGDADFNGDGLTDVAFGNTFDIGDTGYEGAVHIMYGTPTGLTATRAQYWTEDRLGGTGHRWDYFGGALAAGDFDGDGFTDMAIGIPQAELDPPFGDEGSDRGLVRVVYGSPQGLSPARTQLWNWSKVRGGADLGYHFGEAMTAGNFGQGPQDDLAITANNETVAVLHGSTTGLRAANHQLWTLDSPGIHGSSSAANFFGARLESGNFGRGEHADLAIGIPDYKVGSKPGAGAVSVIYGSPAGLAANGNQLWTQNSRGIKGRAERNDNFGAELAAGRLNGTTHDALAVGVPYEDVQGKTAAGAVNVIYGSTSGLRATGDQIWSQATRGVPGAVEANDEFGGTLTVGNYGRNIKGRSFDDLAVGAYAESVGRVSTAGSVTIIYGSSTGLGRAGSRAITQTTPGVPGRTTEQGMFGESLASADVIANSGPALDELFVTMNVGLDGRNGDPYSAVVVASGSSAGIDTRNCQLWTAKKLGRVVPGDDIGFGEPILG